MPRHTVRMTSEYQSGLSIAGITFLAFCGHAALAGDAVLKPVTDPGAQLAGQPPREEPLKPLKPLPEPLAEMVAEATPLNPDKTVLLDKQGGRVLLRTEIACPDCLLEMVCVPERQREHETIFRIRSEAFVIHSALLALGLDTGTPATWTPEFKPPEGTTIRIHASWVQDDGSVHRTDVRSLIRHNIHRYYTFPLKSPPPAVELPYKELRYDKFTNEILWYGPLSETDRDDLLSKWDDAEYKKAVEYFHDQSQSRPMTAEFVFVGSMFYTDPETGRQHYGAEGGHLICVSNFSDALIDVREESSASDGSQVYEGWEEKIPAEETPVILELIPELPEDSAVKPAALP